MARIRTIKPEFWDDEKISELPIPSRLLFIGLWNFADDNGVIQASEKYIKAKVFPYDSLRDSDFKQWIGALTENRMIIPFSHAGKSYFVIRRFTSHQIIDKRYAKEIVPKEAIPQCDHIVTTECSHGDHIVTTPQELEVELEVELEREGSNAHTGAHAGGRGHTRTHTHARTHVGRGRAREEDFEIQFPWPGEKFLEAWTLWKKFKKEQFRFSYKKIAEQAALKELTELSLGSEDVAIAIINQSISKGWQGLFELKLQTTQNGNRKTQRTYSAEDFAD